METTLFIATSLDGYIAGPDDDISWLFTDADYGYQEFFSEVTGLIMGRGTYQVISRMGEWPYGTKPTVVVSRSEDLPVTTPETQLFHGDLDEVEDHLIAKGVENAWLVGGGELVRSYLQEDRIQRIVVSLHPVLLGKGVPLFPGGFPRTMMTLEDAEAFESGLVQLRYRVKTQD